ncbi:hypothetical protein HDU91_004034 [Kappamyces sp. JEL0680]|nr:hypothetical protein HDU91_004034 [Kappamyces sp. JEL0680]
MATKQPESAAKTRPLSSKETPSLPKDGPEREISLDSFRAVVDFQELAPAPSQTYYQVAVYPFNPVSRRERRISRNAQDQDAVALNRESIRGGCVVVRDWPRKRDGAVNPGERVVSFKDFLEGEMDSTLIHIFGRDRYDQLFQAVKKEMDKKKKYQE